MAARLRLLPAWALVVVLALGALPGVALAADPTPPAASGAPAAGDAADAPPNEATTTRGGNVDERVAALCADPPPKKKKPIKPLWEKLLPILLMIGVIAIVVRRLPRVDVGHSDAFRRRRLLNWLPLGLTYAFLYMARYNINVFMKTKGISEAEFGEIFGWGSLVYGLAFFLNGPICDWLGGRITILLSAAGSAVANILIAYMLWTGEDFGNPLAALTVLYCANMYFQSFGAVSIVKVNAAWFHIRERGTFGGIFGILISLGLFLAYDVGFMIFEQTQDHAQLFFVPALILIVFFVLSLLFVRDNPSDAGFADFDAGDATEPDDGRKPSVLRVMAKILSNPIIMTVALIELCSGFLRQAILNWGQTFAEGIGHGDSFVVMNWGVVSCIAGILGGMFAGAISDHVFKSRRLPVAAFLYMIMLAGAVAIVPLFAAPAAIPWVIAFMSMAIIGVHGMLSGTASADFGGKKNTGVAVGIIDGFVYFGSTIQAWLYGARLPAKEVVCPGGGKVPNPAAANIDNWSIWPYAMIPVALVGLVLALILWNARPRSAGKR